MTYRIRIRRQAAHDLLVASLWYESEQHGLGAEFLESFQDSVEILASSPRRYRMVKLGIRRALMRRFPYSIFYTTKGGPCMFWQCSMGIVIPGPGQAE